MCKNRKVLILIIISIVLSAQVFAEISQQEEYISEQYSDITNSVFDKFVKDSEKMFPDFLGYMNKRNIELDTQNFWLIVSCFFMFTIVTTINIIRVRLNAKRIHNFNNLPSLNT